MAEINILLYDCDGNKTQCENILSYELSRDVSAPCDALRLTFISETLLEEINRVEMYLEKTLIFSGFADTQRETKDESGFRVFIYARSLACILVDNEAQPYTYKSPSALALFNKNAKALGFSFGLENIMCRTDYRVSKGTSCYGAINNFVSALTGKNILVTPSGVLVTENSSEKVIIDCAVISEKRVINRGDALSQIDYKNDIDARYIRHLKSRLLDERKIKRTKKLNLSILPEWQRSTTLLNRLKASVKDYNTVELNISGIAFPPLYREVKYESEYLGSLDGYYISSVTNTLSEKGESTRLVLSKNIDLKEIYYVAE